MSESRRGFGQGTSELGRPARAKVLGLQGEAEGEPVWLGWRGEEGRREPAWQRWQRPDPVGH